MRILHIASGDFFSTYGGGQVYVKNIVDAMIDMGLDVNVISLTGKGVGITHRNYHGKQLLELKSPEQLNDAIKEISPNIIHAHSYKDLVCVIGKKLGIPVIVTAHHGGILCPAGTRLNCKDEICHNKINHKDCLPCVLRNFRTGIVWYHLMRHIGEKTYLKLGEFLKNKPFIPVITPIGCSALYIQNKLANWTSIIENCSLMIAPCNEIAEAMVQNGLDNSKIRIIPHGIPLPMSRPDYPPVVDGIIKFYYVGRICRIKGIHVLLEAFHSVKNSQIELHLIGGSGNKYENRYMNTLQKRYAKDKRIIWHGKIAPKAVYEVTLNFHVSISASFLESFGLNIAESLALGKPVLTTRSGGAEIQIQDNVNGWLVPINNEPALSEKISYIASHPEILTAMSDNCQAISISKHINELLASYESVSTL